MECVQNLLLGDPVYDERGQLVRREFGLKNALALLVLGYIAYTLYCSMGKKVFSGKRKGKMKGGKVNAGWAALIILVRSLFVLLAVFLLGVSLNWTFVKGSVFGWALAINGAGVAIPIFFMLLFQIYKGIKGKNKIKHDNM